MKTQLSQEQIRDFLVEVFAKLVKVKHDDVDTHMAFDRYGLDSAAAVEFTAVISNKISKELEPTLLYDYPTIELLTKFLVQTVAEEAA